VTKEASKKAIDEKDSSDNETGVPEEQIDGDGNIFFDLGRDRRITLSKFKDIEMINIREFYKERSSGLMKPGKKGITLNKNEWNSLLAIADKLQFEQ
jgi:Transcriptional Coactivator p15 (PC4)